MSTDQTRSFPDETRCGERVVFVKAHLDLQVAVDYSVEIYALHHFNLHNIDHV